MTERATSLSRRVGLVDAVVRHMGPNERPNGDEIERIADDVLRVTIQRAVCGINDLCCRRHDLLRS